MSSLKSGYIPAGRNQNLGLRAKEDQMINIYHGSQVSWKWWVDRWVQKVKVCEVKIVTHQSISIEALIAGQGLWAQCPAL